MTAGTLAMEVSGRNYEVTDRIRDLIQKKFSKVERHFTDIIEVRCVLQTEKQRNICEIYVIGKDYDVKSVEEADTMETAVTKVINHLARQARKNRDRIVDHHKRDGVRAKQSVDAWDIQVLSRGVSEESQSYRSRIIRTDRMPIKPMSVEEAAMQLDDTRDEFAVFRNTDSDEITVLYKRADGNFGLIATEVG